MIIPLLFSTISFFVVFFTIPLVLKKCDEYNLYSNTNGRNIHSKNIPHLGGVSIFLGIMISSVLFMIFYNFQFNAFFYITFILIFIVGFYDDIYDFSVVKKFFFQCIISILLIFFYDLRIIDFSGLFGLNEISENFSFIFSFIVFLFIINAYNLSDGLDGLATSLALFALIIFSIIFFFNGLMFHFFISTTTFFSLLSFLIYNKEPASIFMGDSGSLTVGFIIAFCAVTSCNLKIDFSGTVNPVLILCVIAYPSVDTIRVFLVRLFSGKSPFFPDRNHLHHLLVDKRFSHTWATFFAVMYCVVLTAVCFLIRDNITLSFIVMVFLAVLFIVFPTASFVRSLTKKLLSFFK